MTNLLNAMSEAFSRSTPVYSMKHSISPSPLLSPSKSHKSESTEGIYRESLQSAVLDKIRDHLQDLTQLQQAQINSLKRTEQDLREGQSKVQSFIQNLQQQQVNAQVCLSFCFCFSFRNRCSNAIFTELFNKSSIENRSII